MYISSVYTPVYVLFLGGYMQKNQVLKYFGTQEKTAQALNISQASVSRWADEVPPLRAFEIERLTNGALKVDDVGSQSKQSDQAH